MTKTHDMILEYDGQEIGESPWTFGAFVRLLMVERKRISGIDEF